MIKIDKKLFYDLTLEQCINSSLIDRIDRYVKEMSYEVITKGMFDFGFTTMETDDQIEFYLTHCLMSLIPLRKWHNFVAESEYSEDEIMEALYVSLKRHYYLNTNEFKEQ